MRTLLITLLCLSSCAPMKASAPHEFVTGLELQNFQPSDYYLVNNKLFLWHLGMTDAEVAHTIEISRDIDRSESKTIELRSEEKSLQSLLEPYFAQKRTLEKLEKQIKDLNTTIKTRTQFISKEMNKPESDRNQEKLSKWNDELEKAKLALSDSEPKLLEAKSQTDAIASELDPANGEDTKGPHRKRLDEITIEKDEVEAKTSKLVADLMKEVDYFTYQPSSISFKFDNNQPSVAIADWGLDSDGVKRSFSTEDGSIINVTYQEKGGVFRFDLGVFVTEDLSPSDRQTILASAVHNERWDSSLREVYSFRVARHAYEKTKKEGRIFFAGELIRRRDMNGSFCVDELERKKSCTRRGMVKLVDRNN